jgi:hypothetical protein
MCWLCLVLSLSECKVWRVLQILYLDSILFQSTAKILPMCEVQAHLLRKRRWWVACELKTPVYGVIAMHFTYWTWVIGLDHEFGVIVQLNSRESTIKRVGREILPLEGCGFRWIQTTHVKRTESLRSTGLGKKLGPSLSVSPNCNCGY